MRRLGTLVEVAILGALVEVGKFEPFKDGRFKQDDLMRLLNGEVVSGCKLIKFKLTAT